MLRLGIIGCGMIGGVIADAASVVDDVKLTAAASRRFESAKAFAAQHGIPCVFETWEELVASSEVDAVFVATPTSVREEISVAAATHGKHVLGDKPFADAASLRRIIAAAKENGVGFMDATHFSHHARTHEIKVILNDEGHRHTIGHPQAIRSAFFFPLMDRTNIRFDIKKEPRSGLGDMAWYNMRAITEYLQLDSSATVKQIHGSTIRDEESQAIVRGSGFIEFSSGQTSTFDFGYNTGVSIMDLDILGTKGLFHLDDYVLDWKSSFSFHHPDHVVGFTRREGLAYPKEFEFIEVDAEPQAVALVRKFAEIAASPEGESSVAAIDIALRTQTLLDLYWDAVNRT